MWSQKDSQTLRPILVQIGQPDGSTGPAASRARLVVNPLRCEERAVSRSIKKIMQNRRLHAIIYSPAILSAG